MDPRPHLINFQPIMFGASSDIEPEVRTWPPLNTHPKWVGGGASISSLGDGFNLSCFQCTMHPFVLLVQMYMIISPRNTTSSSLCYDTAISHSATLVSQVPLVRGNTNQRGNGRVNTCLFSLVLPRFLSLSLFTLFASSISGVLFLSQCGVSTVVPVAPLLPGDSEQGKQCHFFFWLHNGRCASLLP